MRVFLYLVLIMSFTFGYAQEMEESSQNEEVEKSEEGKDKEKKLEDTVQKDEELEDESKPEEEGKPYLFIIPFQSEILTKLENDQASKLMLQVGSKQLDYKLVLSSMEDFKGLKRKVVSVELEIKKVGMTMEVTALMKDVSTNFQLRKKTRKRVNKRSLIREINIVLELLFMSEDEIMEREKKKEREKKFKKRFSKSVTIPDNGLAAFRARIKRLKKNIKKKFDKLEEESKEEAEDEEDISEMAMVKKKKAEEEEPDQGNLIAKRVWVYFDSLSAGIINQNTNLVKTFTTDVNLNTNVPYLTAGYTKGVYLDVEQNYVASGSIKVGQPFTQLEEVNEAEVQGNVDMYLDLAANAGMNFKDMKMMIDAGIRMHSLHYIGIPEIGGGLQPVSNTLLFLTGGISKHFAYYKREIKTKAFVKLPVMTFSADDSVTESGGFSGLGYGFNIKVPQVYWNWLNLEFTMEQSSYSVASGLTPSSVENTLIQFGGFYDF